MTELRVDDRQPNAYGDALAFLYDRINYERMAGGTSRYPFRLQRIKTLLNRLGLERYLYDPSSPTPIPMVHIAGTKGKGSTASMVAAGLTASGLKTGLYTSPHLHDLEERFRVDGVCCGKDDVIALVDRVRPVVEGLIQDSIGSPSFFELTTAMALLHFDSSDCDAIVLEVGLGGRLDSTNVCSPSVTTITSIGLDHQHVLGNTVEEIAHEKAGIIKQGIPVVSGVTDQAAGQVIAAVANKRNAPLYRIGQEFSFQSDAQADWGSRVVYQSGGAKPASRTFDLQLDGAHQAGNAAVAMASLDLLAEQGVPVCVAAISQAWSRLSCAGRIERFLLPENVIAIVDAAHNEDSITALCDCLRRRCHDRRISVVFGTSHDKAAGPMLSTLSQIADDLVITQFQGNPRYQPTAALMPLVPESMRSRVEAIDDPIQACRAGLGKAMAGGALVVCGSFFLAAETRTWLAELATGASPNRDGLALP